MAPRFPPAGPDGHGSPPSTVLSRRYDFLPLHVLRLIVFASRLRGLLPAGVRVRPRALPPPRRRRQRTGVWISRWPSLSSFFAHGQGQDLPGSLAIRPVTLRRSTTPDDPLRLASHGASGTAPTRLTMKASSVYPFRGFFSAASSPAVYASRRALPLAAQDSLPAGGLRLYRTGVEPAGSLRKVSAHGILLSRASPGAIGVGLGPVQLGGLDERGDAAPGSGAFVMTREQGVLSREGLGARISASMA